MSPDIPQFANYVGFPPGKLKPFLTELKEKNFLLTNTFKCSYLHGQEWQGPFGDQVFITHNNGNITISITEPAGPILDDQ
jgi:hypothetical protein